MQFQYIFNILVIIILFFLIFRKSNEALTNITKQDLEGIQNITSMYKNGELKVAKLHVTDDAQFDKNISSKNLHIKDNAQFDKNITATEKITSKHLHINDHASTRRLDIRNDANKGTTHFNYAHQGKNYIRGHNHDKFSTDHIHVSDYLDTRRLDIRNDGSNPTHFNHAHKGKNYLRGYSFVETKDNVEWNGDKIKQYISDIGLPEKHIGFVGIKKDTWNDFPGFIHTGADKGADKEKSKKYQIKGLWSDFQKHWSL